MIMISLQYTAVTGLYSLITEPSDDEL